MNESKLWWSALITWPTCSLAGGTRPTWRRIRLKRLLFKASSCSSVMVTRGKGCHGSGTNNEWEWARAVCFTQFTWKITSSVCVCLSHAGNMFCATHTHKKETWAETGGVEAHFTEPKIWQMWHSRAKHITNNDFKTWQNKIFLWSECVLKYKRDLYGKGTCWNKRDLYG